MECTYIGFVRGLEKELGPAEVMQHIENGIIKPADCSKFRCKDCYRPAHFRSGSARAKAHIFVLHDESCIHSCSYSYVDKNGKEQTIKIGDLTKPLVLKGILFESESTEDSHPQKGSGRSSGSQDATHSHVPGFLLAIHLYEKGEIQDRELVLGPERIRTSDLYILNGMASNFRVTEGWYFGYCTRVKKGTHCYFLTIQGAGCLHSIQVNVSGIQEAGFLMNETIDPDGNNLVLFKIEERHANGNLLPVTHGHKPWKALLIAASIKEKRGAK